MRRSSELREKHAQANTFARETREAFERSNTFKGLSPSTASAPLGMPAPYTIPSDGSKLGAQPAAADSTDSPQQSIGAAAIVNRLAARALRALGAPVKRESPIVVRELTPDQEAERARSKAALQAAMAGALQAIEAPAKPLPSGAGGAGNLGPLLVGAVGGARTIDVRFDGRDQDRRELARADRSRAKQRQEARRARADQKWLAKYVDKQLAAGVPGDAVPPNCQRTTYLMVQEILRDARAFGGKAQLWIRRFADRFPWLAPTLGLIRDAALQPLDGGGFLHDFTCEQSRRIVAEALFLLAESQRTKKRGRYQLIVRGFSVSAIAGIVHRPGNPRSQLSRNRIGGAGRKPEAARANAAAARWMPGRTLGGRTWTGRTTPHRRDSRTDLQRLRDSGFLYAQQLPAHEVSVWERDTKGHVRNRYWLAIEGLADIDAAMLAELGAAWADEAIDTTAPS